jgi:CheY-like chemotaxis protein
VTVGNGRLALEKLPEVRPDIVLCDIIMPEKDGYEVCEQIKRNPAFAHVPVLLLTGAFEPFDQERAARAGYDGSLAKPFEPETLIAKVRDLLARAPQRAAAPPPVVPFARPTPAPPPPAPVFVAQPPAYSAAPPPPPAAVPASGPSFIPDEPFETGVADEPPPAPAPPVAVLRVAAPPLAPMSEEESATLLAPATEAIEPADGESTSTVMFKATDLPWNASPTAPQTPVSPPPVKHEAAPAPRVGFVREAEQEFEPDALDAAEVVDESAVFEEVVEENLEFDSEQPTTFDEAEPSDGGATMMFTGSTTLPPSMPPQPLPVESSASTASFTAMTDSAFDEPELEPLPAPEPEPFPEPEPVHAAVHPPALEPPRPFAVPPPLPLSAQPAPPAADPMRMHTPLSTPVVSAPPPPPPPPAILHPSMAPARPAPPAARVEPAPEPVPAESFADVAPPVEETTLPPAVSEAAALGVPVEMVEKIAQRVVAQISEKAVRDIAWEVIPELAEALIKQEIERLKAELQKL